jgi:ABC-type multidrug transport system ATPase subunit
MGGLTGRETSKVKTYSHGMRARLALAQALLPRPNLLILDRPTGGVERRGMLLSINRPRRCGLKMGEKDAYRGP